MGIPLLALSILAVGVAGASVAVPVALADHSEVTITPVPGSGVPGCEETPEGCNVPMVATVDVGGAVIMSNTDNVAHTFTSGTIDGGADGAFDTSFLLPDDSFEWRPDTAGEYPYFCMVHPWMSGMIIVQGADDHGGSGMDAGGSDAAAATTTLSDGTKVSLWISEPMPDEVMKIVIEFKDIHHVNYLITATQSGSTVLDEEVHDHDSTTIHKTAPLDSSDPIDVRITFLGTGLDEDDMAGPVGEEIVFEDIRPVFDATIAMMESEDPATTGMLSDGTTASLWATEPMAGQKMTIVVEFEGIHHVNYLITATQSGSTVLDEEVHDHDSTSIHKTAPLGSSDPVDFEITFLGTGLDEDDLGGPVGEELAFSSIVPEFGAVAMMILAVAVVSMVAITAKSGSIPRLWGPAA